MPSSETKVTSETTEQTQGMREWHQRADVVLDLLGAKGEERERMRPVTLRMLLVLCQAMFDAREAKSVAS